MATVIPEDVIAKEPNAEKSTEEKSTDEQTEATSPKIITSNDQTEITGAFTTAISKQPSTKESFMKPSEDARDDDGYDPSGSTLKNF